jgi:hypothetical protein
MGQIIHATEVSLKQAGRLGENSRGEGRGARGEGGDGARIEDRGWGKNADTLKC